MKKFLFAATVATAGLIMAQDMAEQSDVTVTGDAGLYSAYIWRGQVLSDGPVLQPALTVEKGPVSLNIWANYNIDGEDGAQDRDVSETDFTLSYAIPVTTDAFDITAGVIHYTFPDQATDDTTELFLSSTFYDIILTPVVSLYYDADQAEGWYGNLALSQGFDLSDALAVEVGGSIGIGEGGYNSFYFGKGGAAMNDYNVYVSASYALTDDISLGAQLAYTMLDGSVSDEAEDTFASGTSDTVWGGVSVSYNF